MRFILYLILVFSLAGTILSETLFPDIIFPPEILNDGSKDPIGHLKPLGWQRPPEGPVKEYDHVISTQDYWENHVKPRVPCVFRQAIKDSPAIKNWKDDQYIKDKYGYLDVLVELKKENRTFSTGRMRFSDFIDRYKTEDLYVVTMLPKPMMREIQAINSVLCGTFKNFTHESNFWMSNGGTRSVIHYDADHNLHCMINGRKDLIMVRNTQENRKWLYMSKKPVTAGSGFSPLTPDAIDMYKYPNYGKVPWHYASIMPGDCVYIPAIYIHQVRAYGRSLSATTLFTEEIIGHKLKFTSEGCTEDKLREYRTMADIDFHWTYDIGDETIDMGYMNVERLRNIFLQHMDESAKKVWDYKLFKHFYMEFSHGEAQLHPEEVWLNILNNTKDTIITKDDVRHYTRHQLKLLARSLDPPHGPKTDGFKKVSITPGSRDNEKQEEPEWLEEEKKRRDRERRAAKEGGEEDEEDDENDDEEQENQDEDGEEVGSPDLVYAEESERKQQQERDKKLEREKKRQMNKEGRDEL